MNQALSGTRVIDMTHNQAGPACAQILAFLGADVIKLEEPNGGDVARRNMRDRQDSDSLFFLLFNANKRSLTLNLKTGRGKELFKELITKSDVLLENFGPGALDRLGLGWKVLSEINPRLIYATIKGFGTYGPYRDYKSYEPIAQAMGGAMSITGFPENPPTYVVPAIGDCSSGMRPTRASMSRCRCRMRWSTSSGLACATISALATQCRGAATRWARPCRAPSTRAPVAAPTTTSLSMPRSSRCGWQC